MQSKRPVYPRSRGEQISVSMASDSCNGLSPLARGTEKQPPPSQFASRFIPARAGNRPSPATTRRRTPVYPRSRGEQRGTNTPSTIFDGLSPLARGTVRNSAKSKKSQRFIPARAGNSIRSQTIKKAGAVYPRSRGEQEFTHATWREINGLSPLARGTEIKWRTADRAERFIPARAGNRLSVRPE